MKGRVSWCLSTLAPLRSFARNSCNARAQQAACSPLWLSPRCCSTVPSEEEVTKAYKVLGVNTASSFADVKKKYVDLAKEHHPDLSAAGGGATASSTRMVDINTAYATVSRFNKAGRKLSAQDRQYYNRSSGGASGSGGGYSGSSHWRAGQHQQHRQQSYYAAQDSQYQPWHEDLDPLLYEMMWEEMRRQNERDPFERPMHPDEFYDYEQEEGPPDSSGGRYRPKHQQQQQQQKQQQQQRNAHDTSKPKEKVKTTTWPEADLKAMLNMYQDGKSFEFIGNALGKELPKVVEEFNRWSNENKKNKRHGNNPNNKSNRNKWQPNHNSNRAKGAFYHMEYPTGPPYSFSEFMVDEDDFGSDGEGGSADPFGYYVGDDYGHYDPWQTDEDGGPAAFNGRHSMSGGPKSAANAHAFRSNPQRPIPQNFKKKNDFFKNSNSRNFKSKPRN